VPGCWWLLCAKLPPDSLFFLSRLACLSHISYRLPSMSHSFQNITFLPSTGPPTLFLPGWGFDGRIVRLFKPAPNWIAPETLLDPVSFNKDLLSFLVAKNIRKVRLVGWSMGAMLGLKFAAGYKDLIDSLVLVSLRNNWPENEIKEIRAEFSRDPEIFLKGFYRKCFLGNKRAYTNFRTALEPLYLAAIRENTGRLQRGLDFLTSFAVPSPAPEVPTRLIHGKQDLIAPVAEMAELPEAEVEIIDNAGHFVFLHEGSSLQQELQKQVIQVKFSRAADSYDSYAKVQAEAARKLAAKLPAAPRKPGFKTILEIGCGTGNFTSLLATRFPGAKIVALDFSPEMLAVARRKLQGMTVDFICAEGERFLQENPEKSFDLVTSNGSLQWFSEIDRALQNIGRILVPGGSMFCSLFGPQSLKELGDGLQALQPFPENLAARSFPAPERLRKVLQNNFSEESVEEELLVKEYESAHDLLLHLKKTGTSGWQQKIWQPLTPSRIKGLDEWFHRTYGSCRVTYQVLFLQGKK
jgi:malonyl-ACP O-methyltransferase BioC